jgi:hypothetical protein
MSSARIDAQDLTRDDEKISTRFSVRDTDLTKLIKLIKSLGGKPQKNSYAPPYDPWFMEGCEWRIYPSASGSNRVYAAFAEV